MSTMPRIKTLVLALALILVSVTPALADQFRDGLQKFVNGLKGHYAPMVNMAHDFLIGSYYDNRGMDLQLAVAVLTQTVAHLKQEADEVASQLRNVETIVADIQAGYPPSQEVLPLYRVAYFARYKLERLHRRLMSVVSDAKRVSELHTNFCNAEKVGAAHKLFEPSQFYGSTAFNVISPPIPDFGVHVSLTFGPDGDLISANAGAGNGNQLPQGYTDAEHALAWGAAAGAAYLAESLGAASAVNPIAAAVVIVGYAILADIKNKDRVKAIKEQVDLMEEADAVHDAAIAELRSNIPVLVEKYCTRVRERIDGPVSTLAKFATTGSAAHLLSEFETSRDKAREMARILGAWTERNSASGDLEISLRKAVANILAELGLQWQTEEKKARDYWMSKIKPTLEAPADGGLPMPGSLSPDELSKALDNLTLGDCQFALCYPLFDEEIPPTKHPNVSAAWLWFRDRLVAQ